MKLKDYLADHIVTIVGAVVTALFIAALLWLIETPPVFISFVEVIILLFFIAASLWDYRRRQIYYDRLLALLDNLNEKTIIAEVAEQPHFWDGQILSDILRASNKYQNDCMADMDRQNRQYREYIEAWVHEIKTPITSAHLIVENEKNPTTLRIDDELMKIDGFVDQALYYARSTSIEKDFKVENTTIHSIVNMAIKMYSKPIIQAGGKIHIEGPEVSLNADKKTCTFVIGQIISNAIKYRKEEFHLTFRSQREENHVVLEIFDNGIGISPADLPRVFDKGFTGENGRRFSKSTGIGLYLCKKLCDKMNIRIAVDSAKDGGTKVTLLFPTESLLQGAGV